VWVYEPTLFFPVSRLALLRLQGLLGTGSAPHRGRPPPVGAGRLRQRRSSERRGGRGRVEHRRRGRLDGFVHRWRWGWWWGRFWGWLRCRCHFWCCCEFWCRGRSRLGHGRCLRGRDLCCLLRRCSVSVERSVWSSWCPRLPVSEIALGCSEEHGDRARRYAKHDSGYYLEHC
jgi:hypothetical protein